MKSNVEEISQVKKKLAVEIEAAEVTDKVNKAYREFGKKAKIHGFRPGKIPREILKRYYEKEIAESVTKALVNETLPMAIEEAKIYPLTMPVVENEELKDDRNFKYSAVMEVKPEFELKDYMGLEVKKEILSVNDDDVEKHLEELRRSYGKLIPVEEPREIKEDDYVVTEYEGFEGDQSIEGVKSSNMLIRVGSNEFHPDFEKSLIGLKKGTASEIRVSFEDSHYNSRLAGKEVTFKVKIIDLKEMELPELNDDFVKNIGTDFNNFSDLKKKIREDIISGEENRIDLESKKKLIEKISLSVKFELPESLIASDIDYTLENLKQNLIRAGSNMEKAGLEEEKLRKKFRSASEKKVKEMLVLGKIAEENNLEINDEELSEGFREMGTSLGQPPEVMRKYYEANNLLDSFKQKLLEEKALNYLIAGAKVQPMAADIINKT